MESNVLSEDVITNTEKKITKKKVDCVRCNSVFFTRIRWAKYCSDACRRPEPYKKRNLLKPKEQVCKKCNKVFSRKQTLKFCSPVCRNSAAKERLENRRDEKPEKTKRILRPNRSKRVIPRWYYVYGWYDPKMPEMPFYIGKGFGTRAWDRHVTDKFESAPCELLRNSKTIIVIYRDNLTEEGSFLCESLLISVFTKMGAPIVNQNDGTSRRESPPLEMPDNTPICSSDVIS